MIAAHPKDASAGVYALFVRDRVIYIGMTIDLGARIRHHRRYGILAKDDPNDITVKVSLDGDSHSRAYRESRLIQRLRPPRNRMLIIVDREPKSRSTVTRNVPDIPWVLPAPKPPTVSLNVLLSLWTTSEIAAEIKCSPMEVSRWRGAHRCPRPPRIRQIGDALAALRTAPGKPSNAQIAHARQEVAQAVAADAAFRRAPLKGPSR